MRVVALPIVCQAKRSRSWAAVALLCVVACARTGLYPGELGDGQVGGGETNSSGQSSSPHGGSQSNAGSASGGGGATGGGAPQPVEPTSGTAAAGASMSPMTKPTACVAVPEECNGRDDDCDGAIDNLPAQPCPGGGFRFCVAGRLSECPRRCDVCVPGSVRVCENAFCSFWGEQECAADGQGFGHCREAVPPPECTATAKKFENSPQLEQCCLDNGYCCLDEHDLNGNGNRREMLGACGDVTCQ